MEENLIVEEFVQTLTPITDFTTLTKGGKIFNHYSLDIKYIDTFDHLEYWDDREIIFYKNYKDEIHWGHTKGCWYYI